MYGVATTVSTAVPNRATRDICIRSCVKSPLKKGVSGGRRLHTIGGVEKEIFIMLNVRNAPFTYNDAIFSGILRPRCKKRQKSSHGLSVGA